MNAGGIEKSCRKGRRAWGIGKLWLVLASGLSLIVWWQREPLFAEPDYPPSEYGSIAKALIEGRGFSDPMRASSGPTAWMPPLIPATVALAFIVTGNNALLANIVLWAGKCMILALGVALLWRTLGEAKCWQAQRWFVPAMLIYGWVGWPWLWHHMHDEAPLFLVLAMTIYAWNRITVGGMDERKWLLGAAALAALLSPVILLVQMIIGLGVTWKEVKNASSIGDFRSRLTDTPANAWLMALGMAGVLAMVWTVRNTVVLGSFIPIKSNAGYELYQAQMETVDGIPSMTAFIRHPFNNPQERACYAALGEVDYIKGKTNVALRAIAKSPGDFIRRVGHRGMNAVACTDLVLHDNLPLSPDIDVDDIDILEQAGLVTVVGKMSFWQNLRGPIDAERRKISVLPLRHSDVVIADWRTKRMQLTIVGASAILLIRGALMSGVPCVLLMFILLNRKRAVERVPPSGK